MTNDCEALDWVGFLQRPAVVLDAALAGLAVRDKCVLITGAGGSIGSGLARAVVLGMARAVVLLDVSERGLYECRRRLHGLVAEASVEVTAVVGSVMDERLLDDVLVRYRPELVLHTAAYKHVPLMEQNPFAAIANNAIGTYRLVRAATSASVGKLVLVSTDKAVAPQSIMGTSKRIAELVVLSHSSEERPMNAVRLGNVLGSSGSVVPLFRRQLESGLPLTVTDKAATRYFLTPAEAEEAILRAASSGASGKIFLADCGEPLRILDLALYVAAAVGKDAMIDYIGLRAGDKLTEALISGDEGVEPVAGLKLRIVSSPHPVAEEIDRAIERLEEAVERFDLSRMLQIVGELVPSYQPSRVIADARRVLAAR